MQELRIIIAAIPFMVWKPVTLQSPLVIAGYHPHDLKTQLVTVQYDAQRTVLSVDGKKWDSNTAGLRVRTLLAEIVCGIGVERFTAMTRIRALLASHLGPQEEDE